MPRKIKNEIGNKYNQLEVIEQLPKQKAKCRCSCGNERIYDLRDLRRGRLKGCGCQRKTPEIRAASSLNARKMIEEGKLNRGFLRNDEFTPFKYILKCINLKNRGKRKGNLTLQDLKDLWEKQNGLCIYSNVKLILPTHSDYTNIDNCFRASLDRIDSSKPYILGNIQFVSVICNYAKHKMSHKEMLKFIKVIKNGN